MYPKAAYRMMTMYDELYLPLHIFFNIQEI